MAGTKNGFIMGRKSRIKIKKTPVLKQLAFKAFKRGRKSTKIHSIPESGISKISLSASHRQPVGSKSYNRDSQSYSVFFCLLYQKGLGQTKKEGNEDGACIKEKTGQDHTSPGWPIIHSFPSEQDKNRLAVIAWLRNISPYNYQHAPDETPTLSKVGLPTPYSDQPNILILGKGDQHHHFQLGLHSNAGRNNKASSSFLSPQLDGQASGKTR